MTGDNRKYGRVALVHDWLVGHRGGERVLLELARLFPDAPIYTLVFDRRRVHSELRQRDVRQSFIASLPGSPRSFRRYLPLFPRAIESFELGAYDLVISTSHCVAKGVIARDRAIHLSYVHTPMRYLWDQLDSYLPQVRGRRLLRGLAHSLSTPLRRWDVASARRPSRLVANSHYVASRIQRFWGRDASVVYPPVDVEDFDRRDDGRDQERELGSLLVVNALVPYKRTELAVDFATRSGRPLTVVGEGPERERLKRRAGDHVRFVSGLSREGLIALYRRASVFLHCGVEDFGIAPVEAMAAGCPVVAFGEGGVRETVVETQTGSFFSEFTTAALAHAVDRVEAWRRAGRLDVVAIRRHASTFSRAAFRVRILNEIDDLLVSRSDARNAMRQL